MSLVHDELLEFLLVAVAELGEVDIGESATEGVHFFLEDGVAKGGSSGEGW